MEGVLSRLDAEAIILDFDGFNKSSFELQNVEY
jgi:hypothetical protein